jgi:hypothetical protein
MLFTMNGSQDGYGPLVGHSPQGFPIYLYTDPQSRLTCFVVVLPDGRGFYCDRQGSIVAKPVNANQDVALALIGGTTGFVLGGPVGAAVGALAGLVLSELSKKRGG